MAAITQPPQRAYNGTFESYGDGAAPRRDFTTSPSMEDHAAQWSLYFGIPERRLPQDPYDSYPRSQRSVEDAFRGRSAFAEQIMLTFFQWSKQFPIRRLLPLTENSRSLEFEWDTWHFTDHMLTDEPAFAVPRLVTSRVSKGKASLQRHGIGLTLGWEFYQTERGKLAYKYHIFQIINAVLFTLCLNVLLALLNPAYDSLPDMYRSRKFASVTIMRKYAQTARDDFGGIHKDPNWLARRILKANSDMRERLGIDGNCLTMPDGTINYANRDPALQMNVYKPPVLRIGDVSGPDAPMISAGGLTIFQSVPLPQGAGVPPMDPLYSQRTNAVHVSMEYQHSSRCDQWRTEMMDIEVWSEVANDFVRIRYEEAFAHTGLFHTEASATAIEPRDSKSAKKIVGSISPFGASSAILKGKLSWGEVMDDAGVLKLWTKILSDEATDGKDPSSIVRMAGMAIRGGAANDAKRAKSFYDTFVAGRPATETARANAFKAATENYIRGGSIYDAMRVYTGSKYLIYSASASGSGAGFGNRRTYGHGPSGTRARKTAPKSDAEANTTVTGVFAAANALLSKSEETERAYGMVIVQALRNAIVDETLTRAQARGLKSASEDVSTGAGGAGAINDLFTWIVPGRRVADYTGTEHLDGWKLAVLEEGKSSITVMLVPVYTSEAVDYLISSGAIVIDPTAVPVGRPSGWKVSASRNSGSSQVVVAAYSRLLSPLIPVGSSITADKGNLIFDVDYASTSSATPAADLKDLRDFFSDSKSADVLNKATLAADKYAREFPAKNLSNIRTYRLAQDLNGHIHDLFTPGKKVKPVSPVEFFGLLSLGNNNSEIVRFGEGMTDKLKEYMKEIVNALASRIYYSEADNGTTIGVGGSASDRARLDGVASLPGPPPSPAFNALGLGGGDFQADMAAVYKLRVGRSGAAAPLTPGQFELLCAALVAAATDFSARKVKDEMGQVALAIAIAQFYADNSSLNLAEMVLQDAKEGSFSPASAAQTPMAFYKSSPDRARKFANTILFLSGSVAEATTEWTKENLDARVSTNKSKWSPTLYEIVEAAGAAAPAVAGSGAAIPDGTAAFFEAALRRMPISQSLVDWGMANNMPPIFNIILFRQPSWITGTGIYNCGDGVTGNTIYARQNFLVSINTAQEILNGHYSIWAKAVIYNPSAVIHFDNMVIRDYVGGYDTLFWDVLDPNDRGEYSSCEYGKDIFACAILSNEQVSENTMMSMTGEFHPDLTDLDPKFGTALHYSTARSYSTYWGWEHGETHQMDAAKYNDTINNSQATLAFRDDHWVWGTQKFDSPSIPGLNKKIRAADHNGTKYPGCADVRRMAADFYEKHDTSRTSLIRVQR